MSIQVISVKTLNEQEVDSLENGDYIEYLTNEDDNIEELIEYDEEIKPFEISYKSAFLIKQDVDKITRDIANDDLYRCSNKECKKRGIVFEDSSDLDIHNSEVHLPQFKNTQCPICNKTLASDTKLVTHLDLRHTPKLFTCDHCGRVFRSKDNLRLHMTHHRIYFNVVCRACKKSYKSVQSLRYHLRQHFEHHQCEACGMVFEHKKLLLGHVAAKHNHSLQVQCHYCTRLFARNDVRDAHEKEIHKNGKVGSHFKCNECDQAFDLRDELMSHRILNHFSGVIHTCEECGKNFKKKSLLELHMHVHRQKSYSCDVCKAFFTFITGLNKHKKLNRCKGPPELCLKDSLSREDVAIIAKKQLMEITVNPKKEPIDEDLYASEEELVIKRELPMRKSFNARRLPHKNENDNDNDNDDHEPVAKKPAVVVRNLTTTEIQEQQEFFTSSSGRIIKRKMPLVVTTSSYRPSSHHKRPTQAPQLSCDFCYLKLDSKTSLKAHLKCHVQGKKHKCLQCSLPFTTMVGLKNHYVIEHNVVPLKEKPFKCDECSKCYSTINLLSLHKKAHENLKEYKCDDCQFETNSPYDLNNHVKRIHHPVRKFDCLKCNKSFKRRCDLHNHYASVHTELKTYVKCPVCDTIVLEKGLPSHMINRHSEKGMARPYVCTVCGKAERYEKNLQRHYDSVHDPKDRGVIYSCTECEEVFYRRRELTAHSFVHYKGVIHSCETCGNNYKSKKELTNHEYAHRPIDFPCPLCNQIFKTKSGRGKHIKKHELAGEDISGLIPMARKRQKEETIIAIIPNDDGNINEDETYEEYEVLEEVDLLDIV